MKETLVGAVQDQVIQIYDDFFEKYTSSEKSKGNAVSKKGKGREDAVWDVDTFAEWCEGIFQVGAVSGTRDDDNDDDDVMSTGRSMSGSMSMSASRSGSVGSLRR